MSFSNQFGLGIADLAAIVETTAPSAEVCGRGLVICVFKCEEHP